MSGPGGDAEKVDVLVVGAGPAGSTAARALAEGGHSVVVVEEHGRVGHPVQCAGLVSERALRLAGSPEIVRRTIHGATVFGPGLGSISFKATEPRGYVIDRGALDVHLADRAARAGAAIRTGSRFDRLVRSADGRVTAELTGPDGRTFHVAARLVVGADGVASAVARAFRLRRPVEILPAFEAEYPQSPGDPEAVEVYLGRQFAPGLFGWWIPDGSGGARVGLAADADGTSARAYFERLLAHLERRFGAPLANPTAYLVSGIPIGSVPRIYGDRVVLVGDAAAQVKPLSGGGIFTGMRGGLLAAQVATDALGSDDLSAASLARYARAWDVEFGEEFRRAMYLRRVFTRLTDRDLDALVDALQDGRLAGTIVAFGDIDFPTHVVRALLAEAPSLVRFFPKAVAAWLSSSTAYPAPDLEAGARRK